MPPARSSSARLGDVARHLRLHVAVRDRGDRPLVLAQLRAAPARTATPARRAAPRRPARRSAARASALAKELMRRDAQRLDAAARPAAAARPGRRPRPAASTSLPSAPTRSTASTVSCRSASGSGLGQMIQPASPPGTNDRAICSTCRKPWVVTRPTRAPLPSRIALVATVVPCSTCATSREPDAGRVADLGDAAQHADALVLRRRGGLGPPGAAAVLVDQQDVGEGPSDVHAQPVAHRVLLSWSGCRSGRAGSADGPAPAPGAAQQGGPGRQQVAAHDALGPVGVAGAHGGDDLEVVLDAAAHRRLVEGVLGARRAPCCAPGRRRTGAEAAAAGDREQQVVEGAVELVDRGRGPAVSPPGQGGAGDSPGEPSQLLDLLAGVASRAAGRAAIPSSVGAQHEDLVELALGPGRRRARPGGRSARRAPARTAGAAPRAPGCGSCRARAASSTSPSRCPGR